MMRYLRFLYPTQLLIVIALGFSANAAPRWYQPSELVEHMRKKPIELPETLEGLRIPTMNNKGYIFTTLNPVAQELIVHEALPTKHILEIGAGFSPVAINALRHGVGSYTANDMSLEHLTLLIHTIGHEADSTHLLQRLMLLHAKAPYELPEMHESYDAILIDKVIHFLNPSEIDYCVQWAHKALMPQGKLYILTISAHAAIFKNKLLPHYQARKAAHDPCPGYVENIFDYCDQTKDPEYQHKLLPYSLTFFCKNDLDELVKKHGFTVEKSYTTILERPDGRWRFGDEEDGGLIALIAVKK